MPVRTISTRIALDGEKEFKNQMASVNSELKTLGSEMRLCESEFKNQANSVEALTAKDKLLNDQAAQQREKVKALEQAVKDASEAYGEADGRTDAYKRQLNNAKVALNETNDKIKTNEKYLDEAKKSTNGCATSIDEFGNEVKKSGNELDDAGKKAISFGDILSSQVISQAIIGGVRALASATKDVANGLRDMVVDGAAFADNIMTMSAQTGISTNQLQEFQYMQELTDVSLDTLTGSMAKLTRNMATAQKGTGAAADAFSALGIEITNSDGTLKNNQDVFAATLDALGKMGNETQRDAYSMQIFGKSAQDLNPLIAVGADGIAKFAEEANNMGYVLSDEMLASLGGVDDSIQRFNNSITAAKNNLAVEFIPGVTGVLDGITQLISGNVDYGTSLIEQGIQAVSDSFEELQPRIESAIGSIIDTVAKSSPEMLNMAGDLILQIIDGIINNMPLMAKGATEIITTLVNGILEMAPELFDGGMQMLATLIKGISDALPQLIPTAVACVTQLVMSVLDNVPLLISAGMQLVDGLAQGALDAIPQIVDAMPEIIEAAIDALYSVMPLLIDTGVKLLTSLVDDLPAILDKITEAMPEIISAAIVTLYENMPKLAVAGVDLFVALVKNMPEIVTAIGAELPYLIKSIVDGIIDAYPEMVDAGKDLFAGIWDGIKSLGPWLSDQIRRYCNDNITSPIKNFFGIRSPSTLMRDQIGRNLALGIEEGFADNLSADKMAAAIPSNFEIAARINTNIKSPQQSAVSAEQYQSGLASAVNALLTGGGGQNVTIKIPITINGKEFARATLSDYRIVEKSMPEVALA